MSESSTGTSAEEMTQALSLEEASEVNLDEKSGATSLEPKQEAKDVDPKPRVVVYNASRFLNKEPLELVPFIEKYVSIQLERSRSYAGFVHSIDPISRSIILSVPKEDGNYQTILIPGSSVLTIMETHLHSSIKPPERKQISGILSADVQSRKKKIISWLKDNLLKVTEEGENVIFGGVTLLPPYGDKDICTNNPVVALDIKKLLGTMPANYEPKEPDEVPYKFG